MCVGIEQQFLLGTQTMLQGKLKQTLEKWRIKSRQLSDGKLKMKFHLILSKVCVCTPVYMYMHTCIKVISLLLLHSTDFLEVLHSNTTLWLMIHIPKCSSFLHHVSLSLWGLFPVDRAGKH